MTEFLIYDLKVAALVAAFYMFYRLLLSRDTLHRMNRVVLLTTAVASFVIPLCVVTIHKTLPLPLPVAEGSGYFGHATGNTAITLAHGEGIGAGLLAVVFLTGVAVTLGHLLWSVGQVVCLVCRSEKHPQTDGTVVCVTNKAVAPFSWMRYIVLSRQDYESPDPAIMAHERGHISQHHSVDVLLVDTLTVLQWFNPAMWMLRQDLRAIHEYEADAAVLSQGINMRQYQYLLIQKAAATCGYSVANGITHSTLKNRITMMLNNKKSSRKGWNRACPYLKLLALLPIVGIALALNAETVNDYVYEDTSQQPQKKVVKKGRKDGQVKLGATIIEVKTDTTTRQSANVNVLMDKKDCLLNPLIILDGERVDYATVQAVDPKAIDHVDVLKDEAAIAQFGEEGKSGVVIITTKKAQHSELSEVTVHSFATDTKDEGSAEDEFDKVFDVVEQMPEFPDGAGALMQFIATNVRYPEAAIKAGVQGRVIVSFIVDAEGRISNTKVVKKVNDDLDAEAIRVIGSMPKWKPGMQNGKAVRVRYVLPITFRLN